MGAAEVRGGDEAYALPTPLLREIAPHMERATGPLMEKDIVNLCELLQRVSGWVRDVPGGAVEPHPRSRRSQRRGRRAAADGDESVEPVGGGRAMNTGEMAKMIREQETVLRQAYERLS